MMEAELAWLAGLIEGEGCIYRKKSYRRREGATRAGITIKMTDEDVVARATGLMNVGSYQRRPPRQPEHKPAFIVTIEGPKAEDIMRLIRPWMGERRRSKIDEVLG
jgi:hypothetical protein